MSGSLVRPRPGLRGLLAQEDPSLLPTVLVCASPRPPQAVSLGTAQAGSCAHLGRASARASVLFASCPAGVLARSFLSSAASRLGRSGHRSRPSRGGVCGTAWMAVGSAQPGPSGSETALSPFRSVAFFTLGFKRPLVPQRSCRTGPWSAPSTSVPGAGVSRGPAAGRLLVPGLRATSPSPASSRPRLSLGTSEPSWPWIGAIPRLCPTPGCPGSRALALVPQPGVPQPRVLPCPSLPRAVLLRGRFLRPAGGGCATTGRAAGRVPLLPRGALPHGLAAHLPSAPRCAPVSAPSALLRRTGVPPRGLPRSCCVLVVRMTLLQESAPVCRERPLRRLRASLGTPPAAAPPPPPSPVPRS